MACTKMNTYHSDEQENRMPDQQKMGIVGDKDVTDGGQDNDSRYETPKTKVMQSKQKSRIGEIEIRSGHINLKG